MSKMQDALKRAAEDRDLQRASQPPAARPEPAAPGAQELWQEVRRLEASLASWSAQRSGASSGQPAESAVGKPQQASSAGPHRREDSVQRWQEAIQRCQAKLASYEEQAENRRQQQAAAQAQAVAQERLVAQAAADLTVLRQRLSEATGAVQAVEAETARELERLAALRECQELSRASQATEEELRVTAEIVAHITQHQRQVGEKLALCQQRGGELQQAADGLRRQLERALVRAELAGPTETAPGSQAVNGGSAT